MQWIVNITIFLSQCQWQDLDLKIMGQVFYYCVTGVQPNVHFWCCIVDAGWTIKDTCFGSFLFGECLWAVYILIISMVQSILVHDSWAFVRGVGWKKFVWFSFFLELNSALTIHHLSWLSIPTLLWKKYWHYYGFKLYDLINGGATDISALT